MSAGAAAPRRHGVAGGVIALAVLLLHLMLLSMLRDHVARFEATAPMPPRSAVVYLRELSPEAPSTVALRAPAPPAQRPAAARPPAPAATPASAVEPPDETPVEAPVVPPAEPPVEPPVESPVESPDAALAEAPPPAEPPASAPALAAAPDAAASAPAFEWPGSTRLSYALAGNWRGEIHGNAQVEWIRDGGRYQVHLDVTVGLPFAPLMTRRMTSDGLLSDQGLVPQRYDEDTKILFRDRRRLTLRFGPETVLLADGRRARRPAGMQDSASQFVQLSWLFTLHPERLAAGSVIELPLALPRHVSTWVYDVMEAGPVSTAFGAVDAVRIAPRGPLRAGDLSAEAWFAPTLRYLPVRIRIRQDDESFIDLVLSRRPELAGP